MSKSAKRVFLVDDSKIFRYTVIKLFSINGFDGELVEFENGQLLLDYLAENIDKPEELPDLVLLDINMPVMGGWDFLEAYSKFEKPAKDFDIRILSSSIDPVDVKRTDEFKDVRGYLTKPLNLPQVKDLLQSRALNISAA